jgi:hypothetical protein
MLTNYNYVKNIVKDSKNKNSYCLNSANGNIVLKPVSLSCNPAITDTNSKLQIKESGNLAGSCKKLSYVRSYQLLSDITKGFYSPLCYRKSEIIEGKTYDIYTDAQNICCQTKTDEKPNIDGDIQFGLYYTDFSVDQGTKLLTEGKTPNVLNNALDWKSDTGNDGKGEPLVDGEGNYIIDPEFKLFSSTECCNNYVNQLNEKFIKEESQLLTDQEITHDTRTGWVYGSKANADLFKIKYNSPVYFKASKIGEGCN